MPRQSPHTEAAFEWLLHYGLRHADLDQPARRRFLFCRPFFLGATRPSLHGSAPLEYLFGIVGVQIQKAADRPGFVAGNRSRVPPSATEAALRCVPECVAQDNPLELQASRDRVSFRL